MPFVALLSHELGYLNTKVDFKKQITALEIFVFNIYSLKLEQEYGRSLADCHFSLLTNLCVINGSEVISQIYILIPFVLVLWFLFIFSTLCVCVCTCVYVCRCSCVCVWRSEVNLTLFFGSHHCVISLFFRDYLEKGLI